MLAGCGDDGEASGDGAAPSTTATGGSDGTDTGDAVTTSRPADPGPAAREVIVVGAGPAGMTAAHRLRQQGVDVQVLEALPTYGGRIKHDREFAEFPIPLGAEWVHVEAGVLDEIVADPAVDVATELRGYAEDDEAAFFDGETVEYGPNSLVFEGDLKFVGSSWLDFFETYVLPGIADRIAYDTPVAVVDTTGDLVRLTDTSGAIHEAEKVIVTVPLKILQRRDIEFRPPLGDDRLDAIDSATVWSGFKAFVEFDQAFYPTTVAFADSLTDEGQRLYYDAAYGQETEANILGLFSVGAQAERYQAMSDDEFVTEVLAELDEVFDGAASASYVRHIVQNWNEEPFAGAAYLEDDAPGWISRALAEPVGDTVFFAGDAYTSFDDWSSVHAAARSAAEAVDELLGRP